MSFHDHEWRYVRHVLRCADADCGAWIPAPLSLGFDAGPAELPARRRKPKPAASGGKRTKTVAAAAEAGSNVVPLSRKRG